MRNKATPEDIDKVLDLLGKLWKLMPHQRLGQLLMNVAYFYSGEGADIKNVLWNMDEATMVKELEKWLEKNAHLSSST